MHANRNRKKKNKWECKFHVAFQADSDCQLAGVTGSSSTSNTIVICKRPSSSSNKQTMKNMSFVWKLRASIHVNYYTTSSHMLYLSLEQLHSIKMHHHPRGSNNNDAPKTKQKRCKSSCGMWIEFCSMMVAKLTLSNDVILMLSWWQPTWISGDINIRLT